MTNKVFHLCKGFKTNKNPSKPIIFYHIPKCAGTTFSVIFSYLFSKQIRIPGSPFGERNTDIAFDYFLKNKKKIINFNPDFIYGHLPYEFSKYFAKSFSLTILRDPMKRCISHFNFLCERGWLGKDLPFDKIDYEDCFKKEIVPSNIITRQLCGSGYNKKFINEEDFNNAKNIIVNKINLICNVENSHDLFNLLISIYDLPNLIFQKEQVSKKRLINIDEKTMNIIRKYNEYDIKLYDYLKANNKFYKTKTNKTPRNNKTFFYSSPDLLINNKKHHFLNEKTFIDLSKKLKHNEFTIEEI